MRGRGHGQAVEDVLKVVRPARELSLALGANLAQTCKRCQTMFNNDDDDQPKLRGSKVVVTLVCECKRDPKVFQPELVISRGAVKH